MISNIENSNRNDIITGKKIFSRLFMNISLYKNVFISFFSMLILSSCVYKDGLQFSVRNLTEDTLVIVTEKIIPEFSVYVSSYVMESDSDTCNYMIYYVNSLDTSFIVPPYTTFCAHKYWDSHDVLSDSPETDGVTPGWKFIRSMKKGTQAISPETWNSERKWIITWEYEENPPSLT